jgi:hypothetical protein
MKTIIFLGAAASAMALAAAPALAQSPDAPSTGLFAPITGYGTLGMSDRKTGDQLEGVTGRLGLRFGPYLGAEAEGTFGVDEKKGTVGGLPYRNDWKRSVGAYAVGYVPVTPRLDVFGRVGLANTKLESRLGTDTAKSQRDSINYGGGAQFFFTGHDGLRADYTHESYTNGPGHANVWGLSYVRKF